MKCECSPLIDAALSNFVFRLIVNVVENESKGLCPLVGVESFG